MNSTLHELAYHLLSQKEEIVDRWIQACKDDQLLDMVNRLTRAEFRDGIPNALDELGRVLTHESVETASDEIQTDAGKHGHHRWKQGFSLGQLIRDWGKLNEVLVAFIEEYFEKSHPGQSASRTEALDLLARFLTEATTGSIHRFDELRRAEAASLASDVQMVRDQFNALNESRGQLLREATHDIRGSLSAVAMATQVLKTSAQPNESMTDVLDALDRGVKSVGEMLNSLLDLSRLDSGAEAIELLSVDIARVLRELVAEYKPAADKRRLGLTFAGPDELIVETDPKKIRRIAQNLLVNALQHTTSGEVRLSCSLGKKRWLMCVADTGPGIQDVVGSPVAKELNNPTSPVLESDSDPANVYRGEGIGLIIVKRLCTMLGAGISLESEWGRGSTFTVELPLTYEGD